jgi:hypothetical protein
MSGPPRILAAVDALLTRLLRLLRRVGAPVRAIVDGFRARAAAETGVLGRRNLVALTLFLALVWTTVLRRLTDLLRAMHLPGQGAFDVNALTGSVRVAHAAAVVGTWLDHAASTTARFTGPLWVAALWLGVDVAFVLTYATLLGVLLAWAVAALGEPPPERGTYAWAYRRIATVGLYAVPVLALADLLEDVMQATIVADCRNRGAPHLCGGWANAATPVGFVLGYLKLGLAVGVLLTLLLAGVLLLLRRLERERSESAEAAGGLWRTIVLLRVQIAAVVVWAFAMLGPVAGPQGADVIRRWAGGSDLSDGLVALATAGWLAAILIGLSDWVVAAARPTSLKPVRLGRIAIYGAALALAGAIFQLTFRGGLGLLTLGGMLLVIVVLSLPVQALPPPEPDTRPLVGTAALPRALAGAVLLVLGIAMLQAGLPELVYAARWWFLLLVVGGVIVQAVGWSTAFGIPTPGIVARIRTGTGWRIPRRAAFAVSIAVAAYLTYRVLADPWATGDLLGTVGSLAVFLVAVCFLGCLAVAVEGQRAPPAVFRAFRLRRIPIFVLVLIWLVVGGYLDQGGYDDVRRIDGAFPQATIQDAWAKWIAKQQPNGRPAVPLVLVASEGGGIRAAYWTASVLDCALAGRGEGCGPAVAAGARRSRAIFAASGISGGSLGLAEYAAHLEHPDDEATWVDDRLGEDDLAPTWAWTLFKDAPNGLLRLDVGMDRAAVLERAWEQSWQQRDRAWEAFVPWRFGRPSSGPLAVGLAQTWRSSPDVPLLLLNGTSVQAGCRVNGSVLNVDVEDPGTTRGSRSRDCVSTLPFEQPTVGAAERATWVLAATHDLADLLCPDQDVRLSTAALISARFPYATPSGRIPRCGTRFAVWTVDGGYFDTSAASPAVELWTKLEPIVERRNRRGGPCIVPVFLQIDNHYTEPRGSKRRRTSELQAPLQAVRAAHDAREHDARQAAALAFQGRFDPFAGATAVQDGRRQPVVRYVHVYPRSHPGTEAPLGWALSQASMNDLKAQLAGGPNGDAMAQIRSWFSPTLRCVRGPGA